MSIFRNWKTRSNTCPVCKKDLDYMKSGNLKFIYCSNPECYYVTSKSILPSIYHKLPAPFKEVIKVLENEKNEAKRNNVVIGQGMVEKSKLNSDKSLITVKLKVKFKEDVTLRPYDSVYYGMILGVVAEQTNWL